jgi:uncharacterized protein YceK
VKIIVTALLVALGLSGCIAVPVYGPGYRGGYYAPAPYYGGGGYYGGGHRYRSERYP